MSAFEDLPLYLFLAVWIPGALYVAGRSFDQAARQLRLRRRLREGATSRVAACPLGYAELHGRVVALKRLRSPYAQVPCVYYRCEVQTRGRNSWITRFEREEAAEFLVQDSTGRALVRPRGARWALARDAEGQTGSFGGGDERLRALCQRENIDYTTLFGLAERSMRVLETVLQPGDEVFVVGTATRPRDPDPAPVALGKGRDPFLIGDGSEQRLLQRLLREALALIGYGVVFGLAAVGSAAGLAFRALG